MRAIHQLRRLHGTDRHFPYFRIELTKDGKVFKPAQRDDILKNVPAGTTDIIVASHGWNNDINDAQALYKNLFSEVAKELSKSPPRIARSRSSEFSGRPRNSPRKTWCRRWRVSRRDGRREAAAPARHLAATLGPKARRK